MCGQAFASDETSPWGPFKRKLRRGGRREKIAVLRCRNGYRRHRVHVVRMYDGFIEMVGCYMAVGMTDFGCDFGFASSFHDVIMGIIAKARHLGRCSEYSRTRQCLLVALQY